MPILLAGQIKSRLAPRSRTVGVGQTVSLTCRTSGKPVDEVLWFKDRHPLDVAKRASLLAVRYCARYIHMSVGYDIRPHLSNFFANVILFELHIIVRQMLCSNGKF